MFPASPAPLALPDDPGAKVLASLILSIADVKAIFLLGSLSEHQSVRSIFAPRAQTASHTCHYYLLVLSGQEDRTALNALQDRIENNLQHSHPVTAIVIALRDFNQWIANGQAFACKVLREAVPLHIDASLVMPQPAALQSRIEFRELEMIYTHASQRAASFFAAAELLCLRGDAVMAAFMLHQSAEQALGAILTLTTGWRNGTHSIDKLLRCCSMFLPQLNLIFPRSDEKDRKLFTALNRAYIDTRYRNDYRISREELVQLSGKVKQIIWLLEDCRPPKPQQ